MVWALGVHFEKASEKVKSSSGQGGASCYGLQNRQEMKRPIFRVDLLYFLPNGQNAYFVQIRHSNLVRKILSACLCLSLKLSWGKYCTLNLWNY